MALVVQPRQLDPMHRNHAERFRQRPELFVRPLTLHGQQPSLRGAQVSGVGDEIRERGQRASDDDIEGLRRPEPLGTLVDDLDVFKTQPLSRALDEARLLPRRLDEREVPVGIDDGERQAGETGSRAHVGDARAFQERLHAQAVEHVLAQHPRPVADGGQIELGIGDLQLIDELEQRIGARPIDLDIELRAAIREQLALGVAIH
jgi:hypothetical protein